MDYHLETDTEVKYLQTKNDAVTKINFSNLRQYVAEVKWHSCSWNDLAVLTVYVSKVIDEKSKILAIH